MIVDEGGELGAETARRLGERAQCGCVTAIEGAKSPETRSRRIAEPVSTMQRD